MQVLVRLQAIDKSEINVGLILKTFFCLSVPSHHAQRHKTRQCGELLLCQLRESRVQFFTFTDMNH